MTDTPEPHASEPRPPRRSLWLSGSWETVASQALGAFFLHSIRAKIVVFAVLATLIPSISTAWLANRQSARSIGEKIDEELRNAASHSAREVDLWLRQREYDVQVLSTRDVVYDYLTATGTAVTSRAEALDRLKRLEEFLTSVHGRIGEYEELLVLDVHGQVLASTGEDPSAPTLPEGWEKALYSDRVVVGDPYLDSGLQRRVMVIAVPVRAVDAFDGEPIGMLAGKVNLDSLRGILRSFTTGPEGETFLLSADGQIVASSRPLPIGVGRQVEPEVTDAVFGAGSSTVRYADASGETMIGMTGQLRQLEWGAVAQVPEDVAFARIRELRRSTLLIVFVLLGVVALIAYYLALLIVRPLDRLSAGAAVVADGDFAVDLPVVGEGEVGYLTEVFNDMVARLRKGRQEVERIHEELRAKNLELERRSITDGLTGLYNRRHFMEVLAAECTRSRRTEREFALLIIDVDHFKKFNDTHGHLAGDDALQHLASVLRDITREADCVARYGGEEFMLLLPDTDLDGATVFGERIRSELAARPLAAGNGTLPVTVSVGIAACPTNGEDPEALIARADEALYTAKKNGRDRVVRATRRRERSGRATGS